MALDELLRAAAEPGKLLIFSGSGLSATSGMSTFSTRNGLYERARKQFKLSDGMKLFTYAFYKQRKADVQVGAGFHARAASCWDACTAAL